MVWCGGVEIFVYVVFEYGVIDYVVLFVYVELFY